MVLCPKCGSETDAEKSQCNFCGKIILTETLSRRQEIEKTKSIGDLPKMGKTSREMAKSLDNLGDDDLFGDLEPFDLDDEPESIDVDPTTPSTAANTSSSSASEQSSRDKPDEDDELATKKFENPMAKSKLLKNIKEDHDLFGSLDD